MLTIADAIEAITGFRPATALVITEAVIDSRQTIPGSLFVAIPGERVDGHDFIAEVFKRGASFALIQRDIDASLRTLDLRAVTSADFFTQFDFSTPFCLRVENTIAALQQIARFWRLQLDLRVIGITGSVGKSTTKEMVAEVLSTRYRRAAGITSGRRRRRRSRRGHRRRSHRRSRGHRRRPAPEAGPRSP